MLTIGSDTHDLSCNFPLHIVKLIVVCPHEFLESAILEQNSYGEIAVFLFEVEHAQNFLLDVISETFTMLV